MMKLFKKTVVVLVFVLATILSLSACGKDTEKKVRAIEVTTLPSKTAYLTGDAYDFTGGVLFITYEDNSTHSINMQVDGVLASGLEVVEFGTLSPKLDYSVVIRYKGAEATFTVSISDREEVEKIEALVDTLPAINWQTPAELTPSQKGIVENAFNQLDLLSAANLAGVARASIDRIVGTAFFIDFFGMDEQLQTALDAFSSWKSNGKQYLDAESVFDEIDAAASSFDALYEKYFSYLDSVLYAKDGSDFTIRAAIELIESDYAEMFKQSDVLELALGVYSGLDFPITTGIEILEHPQIADSYKELRRVSNTYYKDVLDLVLTWNEDYLLVAFYYYFHFYEYRIEKETQDVLQLFFPEYFLIAENFDRLAASSNDGFVDESEAPLFIATYLYTDDYISQMLEDEASEMMATFYNEVSLYSVGETYLTLHETHEMMTEYYEYAMSEYLPNYSQFLPQSIEFMDLFFSMLYRDSVDTAYSVGNASFNNDVSELVSMAVTMYCWDKYEFLNFQYEAYFNLIFEYYEYYLSSAFNAYLYLSDASIYYMEYELGTPNTLDFLVIMYMFTMEMDNLSVAAQNKLKQYAAAEYDYFMDIYLSYDIPVIFYDIVIYESYIGEALMLATTFYDITFYLFYVEDMLTYISGEEGLMERIVEMITEESSAEDFYTDVWIGEGVDGIKQFLNEYEVEEYTYGDIIFEFVQLYAEIVNSIPEAVVDSIFPIYKDISTRWIYAGGSISSELNYFSKDYYNGDYDADIEALLAEFLSLNTVNQLYFLINFEISFQVMQYSYFETILSVEEQEVWYSAYLSLLHYYDSMANKGKSIPYFTEEMENCQQLYQALDDTSAFDNSVAYDIYQYALGLLANIGDIEYIQLNPEPEVPEE